MSGRGRHRRYQPNRVGQASLAVTAGGAGLALPLVGVAGAGSASADTRDEARQTGGGQHPEPSVDDREASPGKAPQPAAESNGKAAPRSAATDVTTPPSAHVGTRASYVVVGGDSLSAIAERQTVEGGWPSLYRANRQVVGADPDLIFPGQRLALPEAAASPAPSTDRDSPPKKADRPGASKKIDRPAGDKKEEPRSEASPKAEAPARAAPKSEPAAKPGNDRKRPASAGFTAPVRGVAPSTAYRAAGGSWSSGHHTGVDFPVRLGTSVKAVTAGTVVSAGWAGAYGYEVVIRHPDGRYSQYAHLSQLSVRAGQSVAAGQQVARSGSTGNSTGPHLHFEVRTGPHYGSDIDPLGYLRAHGVDVQDSASP
ncbi:M23 family metallopeptidase [Streptomyces sp. TP-A0874]|uniref:M23 family metallopeptidase n=1 Tax=Streptomyces sp. TP-A0874 TaxID=549819 RepID=UPI000852909E|nr:M23 family metallopeptidase [Streptomyces sp. TP-A0874]